ncbi:MAG TPA: COX15/CtaA family protein [Chitinophagaceae bacterium]|nr:COX15/CtaA family protein [Chitinophagaceae bacterium]
MNQKDNTPYRVVGKWVMMGVAMLMIMVILGGITRLTGSGLSITEWKVIMGAIPPLNHEQWLTAFEKYKQTPQYHLLNYDFTLSDFKFIFFWEWFHRLWGRLIGFAFIIPFIYFLWKRKITKDMVRPLIFLFVFGALQGAVGWIMVLSGLDGDDIYVEPTRLALHFIFAMGLIAYAFYTGLKWLADDQKLFNPSLKKFSGWMIVLIFVQFIFGALLAGHKGAVAAPTWPDINGAYVPQSMFSHQPWFVNLVDNIITIQFIHRSIAYLILLLVIIFSIKAFKVSPASQLFRKTRIIPLGLVLIQAVLGIIAVLVSPQSTPGKWGVFEWLAQFHQIIGMLLLLSMVMMYFLFNKHRQQP